MHRQHQHAVINYYQRTTRWFLRFGLTRKTGSIHRALLLPGVAVGSPTDAIHVLIENQLCHLPAKSVVVDLGCGVGSALAFMRGTHPEWGLVWGITLSGVQADIASKNGHLVVQGSFHNLPVKPASADAAWAIESFIHSDQPQQFFDEIGRYLRPGGILIICDDMAQNDVPSAMKYLFQHGWLAPNLVSISRLRCFAETAGFRTLVQRDLTHGITLRVLPPWFAHLIGWCRPVWDWSMLLRSMVGSMALQQCLAVGSMCYTMMVFEKQ